MTLGIGQKGVAKFRPMPNFEWTWRAAGRRLQEDLSTGWLPFCVVATVGTTSTTTIDPGAGHRRPVP